MNVHPATHCNTLQHTATLCNTLQHTGSGKVARANTRTATHGNSLLHTATRYDALQHTCGKKVAHTAPPHCTTPCGKIRRHVLHTAQTHFFLSVTHCTTLLTLHHTAPHYPTLQHAATPCNTLRCSATATR